MDDDDDDVNVNKTCMVNSFPLCTSDSTVAFNRTMVESVWTWHMYGITQHYSKSQLASAVNTAHRGRQCNAAECYYLPVLNFKLCTVGLIK